MQNVWCLMLLLCLNPFSVSCTGKQTKEISTRCKKSPFWQYFDVFDSNKKFATCLLCEKLISRGGEGKKAETGDASDVQFSDAVLKLMRDQGITDEEFTLEVKEADLTEQTAVFLKSKKGKKLIQYNGHKYKETKEEKTKNNETKWICSKSEDCTAFIYLNEEDEIIIANQKHNHEPSCIETMENFDSDSAVVITSRKGKEMLLFRQFTYRRQYRKGNRSRWVCSTLKNCRACVFTDAENCITVANQSHCHNPPRYYLKPSHVMEALRQPVIIQTE